MTPIGLKPVMAATAIMAIFFVRVIISLFISYYIYIREVQLKVYQFWVWGLKF